MVLDSMRAIERNDWIRRCLRARFPVLIVDEYQDLGEPLHRVVLSLCFGAGIRLVAVGDPDQSIYGFTGARPELLRELADRADVQKVTLQLNYRSGQSIVAVSQTLLDSHRGYVANSDKEGSIDIHECPGGIEEQAEKITGGLLPASLAKGYQLGNIAVLYPSRNEGAVIEAAAQRHGLSYVRVDQMGYTRSPLIIFLEDCAAWCVGGWRDGKPPLTMLLRGWLELQGLRGGDGARETRLSLVRFLYKHRAAEKQLAPWLGAFSEDVLNEGVRERLVSARDDMDAFDGLLTATSSGHTLAELDLAAFGGATGSADRLNLITIHSAKGSEYDVVFLLGLDESRLPSYYATQVPAQLAEARRAFYVGLTRARHEVHLLWSGWTVNKYGRRFDNGRSRFLVEVQNALKVNGV